MLYAISTFDLDFLDGQRAMSGLAQKRNTRLARRSHLPSPKLMVSTASLTAGRGRTDGRTDE